MIAYHIDRNNLLSEGQQIYLQKNHSKLSDCLFGGSVSQHGINYLSDSYGLNTVSSLIEYEFELVRRNLFPDHISRYQCFFALENISDVLSWISFLDPGHPYRIFEIEFNHENYHKYDASFLFGAPNLNDNFHWSPQIAFENAIHYWSGSICKIPQPELLIMPPVTIKSEKHLTIGLT